MIIFRSNVLTKSTIALAAVYLQRERYRNKRDIKDWHFKGRS